MGSLLMIDNQEAVMKANELCNLYGIDTITTGGTIAMAFECYEKVIISKTDTGGLELIWGNAEAMVELVDKIGKREGLGEALADGMKIAAEKIGKGAEMFAVGIRGKAVAYHDARIAPAQGAMFVCDANIAHHMDSPYTNMLESGRQISEDPLLQAPELNTFGDYDKKGPMYVLGTSLHQLLNSCGLCALLTLHTPLLPLADLIAGAAGWDFDWAEGLRVGRRMMTLRHAFNVREGITPDDIDLPKRLKEEPLTMINSQQGEPVKIDFDALKNAFYKEMEWDIKTGRPSEKTLKELGIFELV